jgi:hypothetical protein
MKSNEKVNLHIRSFETRQMSASGSGLLSDLM